MIKETERDIQDRNGGAGIYSSDFRKHWQLENSDWNYDKIPEIYEGHNLIDFYDPEIENKFKRLLEEEIKNEVILLNILNTQK